MVNMGQLITKINKNKIFNDYVFKVCEKNNSKIKENSLKKTQSNVKKSR